MGRKLVVILTSLNVFVATQANALGLGDITLESALNQPLSARIELLDLGNLSADDITIRLASASDFSRFSLDRPYFLESIDFMVQETAGGAVVELSTPEAVREPYLSFVVEARWPSGRLLSEYTVLLDLPVFGNASVTQTAQPPARIESQDLARGQNAVQQNSSNQAGRNLTPAASERLAAPQPPADAAAGAQDQQDQQGQQNQQDAQPDSAGTPGSETIVVEPEDTLWDIALQVRPDSSVSVQQTMLALQELNQDAFIGNNINMIRRGQVLRVPDAQQIRAITRQQAVAEVGRQNQLFSDRRNVPLTSEVLTAPPAPAGTGTAAGRGELTVVTADQQQGDDSGTGSDAARIAQLANELAVSTEEVDRIRLQNAELTERLSMLEEQIASAQEIIRLRDLELAQLQQTLAAAQTQEPASPADPAVAVDTAASTADAAAQEEQPPTVVTMAPESLPQRLLSSLMANSWALLLGVLALILLLVLLLRRNRAAEEYAALADGDADLDDEDDDVVTPSVYTASAAPAAPAPAVEAPAEFTFDGKFDDGFDDEDEEDLAPVKAADAVSLAADREEEELLDEVDAFIAYERYPEARALLQNAIVANPSHPALRLKLIELYAITQDVMGFHLQEAELRTIADAPVLARIEELRRRLPAEDETDMPLPEESDDEFADLTETDELEIELDLAASAEVDDQRVLSGVTADEIDEEDIGAEPASDEADDDFDFDLDEDYSPGTVEAGTADAGDDDEFQLDDLPLEEPSVTASLAADADQQEPAALEDASRFRAPSEDAAADAAEEPEDIESVDFDFSLDDLEDTAPALDAEKVADSEAIEFQIDEGDENEDLDIEFDMDDLSLDVGEESRPEPELEAAGPASDDLDGMLESIEFTSDDAEADESGEDDFELDDSFLADSDEASTKLDLARAYIDMGDSEGAREILQEVLQEGTDEQIRDAEELLEKTQ